MLLVADEVICGFWRTGAYWGSQTLDIKPEILTCAKALSSAYLPISAIMISDALYQGIADETHALGTFGHGFTYSGHPVPAAVAVETLKIYDETDIGGHVAEVGPYLQAGLRERFADHPLVGEVRGVGLIGAVELVEDKTAHRNFDPKRKIGVRVQQMAEARGVIGRAAPNDSLVFSPPLIISRDEIDAVLDGFAGALDDVAVEMRRESIAVVA